MTFDIRPLSDALGAVVTGLDPAGDLHWRKAASTEGVDEVWGRSSVQWWSHYLHIVLLG